MPLLRDRMRKIFNTTSQHRNKPLGALMNIDDCIWPLQTPLDKEVFYFPATPPELVDLPLVEIDQILEVWEFFEPTMIEASKRTLLKRELGLIC